MNTTESDSVEKRELHVTGKHITIYEGADKSAPIVYFHSFEEEGEPIYQLVREKTERDFTFVVISGVDWDNELSPWEVISQKTGKPEFGNGANAYIEELVHQIIPAVEEDRMPASRMLVGYSFAGLFALYTLYRVDVFSAAGSMSGSLWFPNFADFAKDHPFVRRPEKIYLSLGDKEAKARHPLMRTVEEKTGEIARLLTEREIPHLFEMNPGGHFRDKEERVAKGITWLLET